MTLVDFLLARIAEDEQIAHLATAASLPEGGFRLWTSQPIGLYPRGTVEASPSRVLAECEAKRRIIEWVTNAQRYAAEGQPGAFDPEDARALTHALRLLALPYADHPDYREEWRP